jgi:hypothetical protein
MYHGILLTYAPLKNEQTECSETLAFITNAGESPGRKQTAFRTQQKFKIEKTKGYESQNKWLT